MNSRFEPPRCPNQGCKKHRDPTKEFYAKQGYYHPLCRPHPVPRFRCKTCRTGFSRQTFRADFKDHRPDLNPKVFELLASGLGLRQTARILKISRRCLELKARKIGWHLRWLSRTVSGSIEGHAIFVFDEMETFEQCRRTKPLTLPVLVEHESMFIVGASSAPKRAGGSMPMRRKKLIARREAMEGPRRNGGPWCIRKVLRAGKNLLQPDTSVELVSDKKSNYKKIARAVFAGHELKVRQYSSKQARNVRNPLFRINLTNAMARDLNGRLRRRSWLASKRRWFLDLQLEFFMAWRNFHRPRFNRDAQTPAQIIGFTKAQLTPRDMLSWRQDWGELSCPVRGVG